MAEVLPYPAVVPPQPWHRRHQPMQAPDSKRGYEVYRTCLRWEFAFSCPFCLLHEVQIAPKGATGSALFWLEHIELQSQRSDLINVYSNLVYACRSCNRARKITPRQDAKSRRLLDPGSDAWTRHFTWEGFTLSPKTDDGTYTKETYDLNSPAKVALREELAIAISDASELLQYGPQMLADLMENIRSLSGGRQATRFRLVSKLHRDIRNARATLLMLGPIPHDASQRCRCNTTDFHEVPSWLSQALLTIDLPP